MKSGALTSKQPERARTPRREILLALVAVAALVSVFVLLGAADLLLPSEGDGKEGLTGEGLTDLQNALRNIEGPATAVFGTLSFLGLVAGGGMAAMGMQQGIRIMITAGLAGGGVLLGKGLIA